MFSPCNSMQLHAGMCVNVAIVTCSLIFELLHDVTFAYSYNWLLFIAWEPISRDTNSKTQMKIYHQMQLLLSG